MKKNVKVFIILIFLFIIFTLFGGTLAYYTWQSSASQKTGITLSFNSEFSCAADIGGNITSGDARIIPTTVSDVTSGNYIKREVAISSIINTSDKLIYMNLWLDINEIGNGLSNSQNFKYALTKSSESNTSSVVSSGNFYGKTVGDKVELLTSKEYISTTSETYYLWIWLDALETNIETAGQTFNFSLDGECVMNGGSAETVESLQIMSASTSYQMINARAITADDRTVTSYAVTTTDEEPTTWENISSNSSQYNLKYITNSVGNYYVWFKDSVDIVVNQQVTVSEIDDVSPVCTFGEFSTDTIANGESAKVELTCIDSGIGISSNALDINNFTLSNSGVELSSNIEEYPITNGYKYVLTILGNSISTNGQTEIILNSGAISDMASNVNSANVESGSLLLSSADKMIPVITFNPEYSSDYGLANVITITVSDNVGVRPSQSINYRWQKEEICSTNAADYTLSVELDNKVLSSKSATASIYTIGSNVIGISGLNGGYYLCVYEGIKDSFSNTSVTTRSPGIYLFDTVVPTLNVSVNDGQNFSSSKEATFLVEDSGPSYLKGGTYTIKYAWSTSSLGCRDIPSTNTVSIDISNGAPSASVSVIVSGYDGEGKIYACPNESITDISGNKVSTLKVASDYMYLDNGVPTIKIKPSNGRVYEKNQDVEISIEDAGFGLSQGTYSLRYDWSTEELSCNDLTKIITISANNGDKSVSKTINISNDTGAGNLYVCNTTTISDTNNNVLSANQLFSEAVYLDNISPDMTLEVSEGTTYKNRHVGVLTITDSGGAGFSSAQTIKYDFSTKELTCADLTKSTKTTSSGNSVVANINITSGNGIGKLYVCNPSDVADGAGNIITSGKLLSADMYMDTGNPEISLVVNNGTTLLNENTGIVTISDSVSGLLSGTYEIEYEWSTKTTIGLKPKCGSMANSTQITVSNSGVSSMSVEIPITNKSGEGYLYICNATSISDVASNSLSSTTLSEKMYLKNSNPPEISISITDPKTYSKSKNATLTVSVVGDTSLSSGTYNLKYGWSLTPVSCSDLTNSTSFSVSSIISSTSKSVNVSISGENGESGPGKLYVCNEDSISDKEGSVLDANTIFSSDMYLDNTAPSGTVSVNATNTVIDAVVSASDNDSGIVSYGYYYQKDNASCPSNGYVSSSNSEYNFLGSYTSGTYYVCVQLTDNAGNVSIISGSTVLETREIQVNGAVNDTIDVAYLSTGEVFGTITTDSTGRGSSSLDNGEYLFISGVAMDTSNNSDNYSKRIVIDDDTEVINFYPDGAIYWYGNGDDSTESLYSMTGGISSAAYYRSGDSVYAEYESDLTTGNSYATMVGTGTSSAILRVNARSYYFSNSIVKGSYVNIKSRYSLTLTSTTYTYSSKFDLVATPVNGYTALGSYAISDTKGNIEDASIDLTSISNNSFYYNIYLKGKGSTSRFQQTLNLYAVWLE